MNSKPKPAPVKLQLNDFNQFKQHFERQLVKHAVSSTSISFNNQKHQQFFNLHEPSTRVSTNNNAIAVKDTNDTDGLEIVGKVPPTQSKPYSL